MYYFMFDNHNSKNQAIDSHNDYDREICDNCGGIYITYKGIYNFRIMGKLYDYYLNGESSVISEKFLNILKKNGFTGYEISGTTPYHGNVTMEGDPIKEKYYLFKVTGRCGLVCDMNGEPLPHCKKCGRRFPFTGLVTTGVSFDTDSYDGSDLFAFENMSNIPIVSEGVKNVLSKSKLSNLRFEPINERIINCAIKRERALKRIEEGMACNELIEAWLKYGVLTEQELNEQLSKNEN